MDPLLDNFNDPIYKDAPEKFCPTFFFRPKALFLFILKRFYFKHSPMLFFLCSFVLLFKGNNGVILALIYVPDKQGLLLNLSANIVAALAHFVFFFGLGKFILNKIKIPLNLKTLLVLFVWSKLPYLAISLALGFFSNIIFLVNNQFDWINEMGLNLPYANNPALWIGFAWSTALFIAGLRHVFKMKWPYTLFLAFSTGILHILLAIGLKFTIFNLSAII